MSNLIPFQEMQGMAEAIAKSGLFGMKDVNSVLALMAVAQAEGLHPASAARDYHIIQGRPALKADAMLARFQQAGGRVDWTEYTDSQVTGRFTHPNGGSLEVTWTIAQAQAVGLVKSGSGWSKFPRAMLRSRCISEGIRSVYPGCVVGSYTPEEVADFEPPRVKDMGNAEVVEKVEGGSWHLCLPGGEIYSSHASVNDWVEAYRNMLDKVKTSGKLTLSQKEEKLRILREANDETRKKLDLKTKAGIIGYEQMFEELPGPKPVVPPHHQNPQEWDDIERNAGAS